MLSGELEAQAAGWATKTVVLLIAGTAVLCIALYIGYQTFIAPINAKHDVAAANGQATIAKAGQDSAKDAGKVVEKNGKDAQHTDTVTRTNYVYITKQPGASDPVNPALYDAFIRSVCVRDSAAGLPECHGLQQPNP